jgi:hypothetical protein
LLHGGHQDTELEIEMSVEKAKKLKFRFRDPKTGAESDFEVEMQEIEDAEHDERWKVWLNRALGALFGFVFSCAASYAANILTQMTSGP